MKVRIPNATNKVKCFRCGNLMKNEWYGHKCKKCGYEQLNNAGRDFIKEMNRAETI